MKGIVIACEGDKLRGEPQLKVTDIPSSHPMFKEEGRITCPISLLIGVPLVVHRHLTDDPLEARNDPSLKNDVIATLMVQPREGGTPRE